MVLIKSPEEIELIRASNILVSRTLGEIVKLMQPGIATLTIDKRAKEFIHDHGAKPAFLGYRGFPNTLCISVNDMVVHGIPSSYKLREGDIVSVDCGTILNGYYGDSAYTFMIGQVNAETRKLLEITKEALYIGIESTVEGHRTGDIGYSIQKHAEYHGYSVVRELVGHGVGKALHEKPEVPNFGRRGKGTKLKTGMVIAIEPMINMGQRKIRESPDGWTIRTADGKPSAHFEHTVAIKKGNADILSTFKYIEEELKKNS